MRPLVVALVVVFAGLVGCSSTDRPAQQRNTADQMYQQAQQRMAIGSFALAAQTLQQIETRYPFGPHANQVQLDLIYVYYRIGDQDRALTAIDRFTRLNPNHADVDYVRYMRGLVHLQASGNAIQEAFGVDRAQRDPTYAELAFEDFKTLIERHPNSTYVKDARARLLGIASRLARYELAVAEYYQRREAYMAAATRGQYILENFPQTPEVVEALETMIRSYQALDMEELEQEARQVLALNFPQHPLAN